MAADDKLILADKRFLPRRESVCPLPDATYSNASFVLNYTAGNLTRIDMTIDGTEYQRTMVYSGSQLDTVSVWVKQ